MRKTFDFINFFYGIGAAIVLIAALFKFLGWKYANEFFLVGLTTEAAIFVISSFAWRSEEKQYAWEKVFPGIDAEGGDLEVSAAASEKATDVQLAAIAKSVNQLNASIENLQQVTSTLTKTVQTTDTNYQEFAESNKKYQSELDVLRKRIAATNESLKSFEKFNAQG